MARARPSSPPDPLDRLLGEAPAVQALRAQIRHLARFDAVGHAAVPTVLLQGETGTGKGLVARVIHDSGPRAQGPFIEVNCAAIPETLLEAELFGVEAGAFTDAKRAKPGLFEAGSGGTLFLDEIAALSLPLQGKCLTAIETKRVRRLGAVVEQPLDVKLIAATQVALGEQVQAGRFRADLFHRLAVVVLELPPLRMRGDDILVLARALLQQYGVAYGVGPQRLSQAAEAWLVGQPWPGNVRELSHLLERVALLEPAMVIDPESLARLGLPPSVPEASAVSRHTPTPGAPLHESERLAEALRQSGGNLAAAARLLGMSRSGLRHRLHTYGLTRPYRHQAFPLLRQETGARDTPPPSAAPPTVSPPRGAEPSVVSAPQGGEGQHAGASAHRDERRVWPPRGESPVPAAGWEPKPVAVLAIEASWPARSEGEAGPYEPWTLASHWEQRMVEKVVGLGGVILQGSPSLCLVAFGLPQTLEQLPQRAVQAALAIRHLAAEAQTAAGETAGPVVRLAGHLGTLLVAAETGAPPGRWLAVGETLSLPVRLLGHATPGELLVSPPMARLTDGWMETQARPLSSGAEPADPLLAHRVVGLLPRQAAFAGMGRRAHTPFLGRAHELATLQAALAQVESGRGQVVGIVGEPGMGKSRLLAAWRQSLTAHTVTYLEGHCWSYGSATPYLPVLDLLRAHCGITPDDSVGSITAKVRGGLQRTDMTPDDWAPYLLRLLAIQVGTEALVGVSPETLKAKTFEALRQLSLHESQQHPLVIAVEDLQWIDPTSEEFFASLVECFPGAAILCLVTYRPGYRPPWLDKSYVTQLTLSPLSPENSVQVVRAILSMETVPVPLAQAILAKAQGNPFFLEEIAQTLVEQGRLGRAKGEALPPALQLPATLQGVLAARIDRLPAEPKALLQMAAVIGKTCARDLLQRVADLPDTTFWQQVSHLQRAEFLYEQPASPAPVYTFKHILIQEVAYASLPQARKHTLHERTAQTIEALAGERLAEHDSELAHHYSRSGNTQQAIAYLLRAGQQAADRSAYREAITHLTRGLELLQHLPDAEDRIQQELDLQLILGRALIVIKGQAAPEAAQAFTRARALCQQLGETPQIFEALAGLRMIHEARGELPQAQKLAEQLLSLAQRESHHGRLMRAYNVLGATSLYWGAFARARVYLDQGIALDTLPRDRAAGVHLSDHLQGDSILGVSCRRHVALTLWYLGYPEQARQRSQEAIALAQELAHPHSLAYALYFATQLHCLRREAPAAQAQAEALMELARHQEFPAREVRGTVLRGWVLAAQGQNTEGMAQIRQGMDAERSMGARLQRPYDLALLAEASAWIGQTAEALRLLDEALGLIRQFGGYFYQAEVYRLTGKVLLIQDAGGDVSRNPPPERSMMNGHVGEVTGQLPRPTEAEPCFRQALHIARQQQAKSLELRAAMSLSRLWQQQGRYTEAYQLLAPIYGWFTEGFDTADLQEAKALLEALANHG